MSEFAATIREALAALAEADRKLLRFGAAHHRYELAPPLRDESPPVPTNATPLAVGTLWSPGPDVERAPSDLFTFATTVGSGGAGPYYGWIPIDRAIQGLVEAPPKVAWTRALPIAHLGCGYAAVCPLDGDARGEIWLDARGIGLARPIHPSFTAFYLDWIDRLAHNAWPEAFVPPGVCALPGALGGYLGAYEQAHGIEPGTLAGEALRDALAQLGPQASEIAGEPPLFERGARVDPCVECARLVENLGLPRSVIAAGRPPRAVR